MPRVVGLDIGGANLKGSDGESRSVSEPFALWREPQRLAERLAALLQRFGPVDALAVTMTAELADCFATKADGVRFVLEAVSHVAAGRPVAVWQTGGEFLTLDEAREFTMLVAAANWHALATWAGRMVPEGCGLLIDVGSTTSDIIPLEGGLPLPTGLNDVERLLSGELVYTGVRRTPVCAVASDVPLRGERCPLAAEVFATMRDAWLLTGELPESPDDCDTADGRPATRAAAHNRIAHAVCCDTTELSIEEAKAIAVDLTERQISQVAAAIRRVAERLPSECNAVLFSGSGEFAARRAFEAAAIAPDALRLSIRESLGPEHSEAACAFALSRLARERLC